MTQPKQKWEYATFPIEFGDPYWNRERNHPEVKMRTAVKGGLWINTLGEDGWEFVAVFPTSFDLKDMPKEFKNSELNHLYFGIFKRQVAVDKM